MSKLSEKAKRADVAGPVAEILEIDCQSVRIGTRLRRALPNRVSAMAGSIRNNGVRTPIDVVRDGDGYRLLFGLHRLMGSIDAGFIVIPAQVWPEGTFTEDGIREREIAENMERAELTSLERAIHIAAWVELFQKKSKSNAPDEEKSANFALSFSDAAQEAFGLSRRSVFLALKIARIPQGLRDRIDTHPIANNQSELLALASESEGRQKQIIHLLTEGKAVRVGDAIAQIDKVAPLPKPKPWEKLSSSFSAMNRSEQHRFFDLHSEAIERWLAERSA